MSMNPDDSDDTITPTDDTDTDVAASVAVPDTDAETEATSTSDEAEPSASSDVSDPSEPSVVSAPAPSIVASTISTPAPDDLRPASDAYLQSIRPLSAIAREQREHAHMEELMAFATKKGSVTREDARLLLRISRSTATRFLSDLVKQGRLVMTGPKSETVYKLSEQ